MEQLLSNSGDERSPTVDIQQSTSPRSLKTTTDEDETAFKTCVSGRTSETFGSPTSSRLKVSKKLGLSALYNNDVQLRAKSEATDETSERSERRGIARRFLSTIYGGQERGALQRHGHVGERDLESNSTLTGKRRETFSLSADSPGTPVRKHKGANGVNEWASAHHIALDQLRKELDDRLRTDVNIRPELRNICHTDSEEKENGKQKEEEEENEREVHRVYGERVFSYNTIESSPESSICRFLNVPKCTGAERFNEVTIEHSNPHDILNEESSGEVTMRMEKKARERRQRVEAEVRNKELSECTFHPQVSPTSATIFSKVSLENGNVFDRLYPQELRDQADKMRDKQIREELESLERDEKELLRKRCGGVTVSQAGKDTFELFLYNVLGPDESHKSGIQTDYMSPLAKAWSVGNLTNISGDSGRLKKKNREDRQYRIASFDEFLQRQNAHHGNKCRSMRNLEKALTPSFKPEITENSVHIAKELLARSSSNSPLNSVNASALASAVKKHRSPYVDPCTFKPKITAVSSAMAPRGVESMAKDSVRLLKWKKAEQEKAMAEELKYPFRPTLNNAHNKHVESFLTVQNYPRYEQSLRLRKERMAKMKEERDAMKENKEVERSTFHPKTTRKPEYVARMASSFALVRQQFGEL